MEILFCIIFTFVLLGCIILIFKVNKLLTKMEENYYKPIIYNIYSKDLNDKDELKLDRANIDDLEEIYDIISQKYGEESQLCYSINNIIKFLDNIQYEKLRDNNK